MILAIDWSRTRSGPDAGRDDFAEGHGAGGGKRLPRVAIGHWDFFQIWKPGIRPPGCLRTVVVDRMH